jgi:hypothetical protein
MATLIFIMAGFLGLLGHWFKRYARGQSSQSFYGYMTEHWKHSAASVVTMIAAVLALANNELSQQSLSMAFLAGYSIDSMVNK